MPYIFKKYYPLRNIVFFQGEGVLIFLSLNAVYFFWEGAGQFGNDAILYSFRALVVTLIFQLCLYYFDLYDLGIVTGIADNITRITQAFGFGCIALGLLYYFIPVVIISTKVFLSAFLAICASIVLWRLLYFWVLERKLFTQPIAIVGVGNFAKTIVDTVEAKQDSGYKIVTQMELQGVGNPLQTLSPSLESHDLRELCLARDIEKIVLAVDERRGQLSMHDLISYKFMGIEIVDGVAFYEDLTGKMPVEKVNPSWFLFSNGFHVTRLTERTKRVLDILISFVGLLVSLPITLLTALIIKLESPGPIFYRQQRVGHHGEIFEVIKFRSMCQDAEKNGAVWAVQEDSRVTRFGAIIRKTRIDEIPQMYNVLRGDMSFVGPRPERPVFVRELAKTIPFYSIRHVVKPGITGWAQVCYPYGASEEDALRKLEYDLFYLKNLSLSFDMFIIFQTVKIVLFQRGAR
ncbi:MAG: TIGR03013 family XrtA/PEP-CTERM system glycosyltransferase [Thermodesulfobacteriota bacterium]